MSENPYQSLLQALDEKSLILTVNQRLARYLQEINADLQIKRGREVWLADGIISFSTWLDILWQSAIFDTKELPLVLNLEQEQALWQQIITKIDDEGVLLSANAAAKQALKAWRLLCEWNLSIKDVDSSVSEDVLIFTRFALAFQACCQKNTWISEVERARYIIQWLQKAKSPNLPKIIYLIGFIEHSPQMQRLLEVCEKLGVNIQHWQLPRNEALVEVSACQDEEHEYRTSFSWAYDLLQNDSSLKLAIITPQLQNQRLRIERLANEYFSSTERSEISYSLSGGTPLIEQPIIYDAWLLLQLNSLNDYEKISRAIRSPFIFASKIERAARDRLDWNLRQRVVQNTHLSQLLNLPLIQEQAPKLLQLLKNCQQYSLPKSAAITVWIGHWLNLLNLLGWPGEGDLNSDEYQAVNSFYECLEKLESNTILNEEFTAPEAFSHLSEKLRGVVFQAEGPQRPSVQILGVLEASGLIFDQIWLCGMHEQDWPASVKANPFLPISLQRKTNMPHATAERELKYAKALFVELRAQCQKLWVSYPCWQDDIEILPSALLRHFPIKQNQQLPWRYRDQFGKLELESINDQLAPPVSPSELMTLEGGYKIFQQQALCPFQAFAARRLKVAAFPKFTEYLDHRLRGILLHSILESTWRDIKTHARLVAMSAEEINNTVVKVVTQQLAYWQKRYPELLTGALVSLEQQRLEKLLTTWLYVEIERPSFTVVAEEEVLLSEMAGIPLKMRIDRIDELAGGQRIIIDYKTGMVNCKDWFGERPSDPQLPLYAFLTKAQGIVYAQLRAGKQGFMGVADNPDYLPNVSAIADCKHSTASDWSSQLEHWQSVFEKLAAEFKEGEASVAPKSVAEACRNCDFQALCRINEIAYLDEEGLV